MKLLKIGAIWCSGCLIMNSVISKVRKQYDFDYSELDLDMNEEEVLPYNPGDVLPVFIVFDGEREVSRFVGEYTYDEFVLKLKDVGVIHEED